MPFGKKYYHLKMKQKKKMLFLKTFNMKIFRIIRNIYKKDNNKFLNIRNKKERIIINNLTQINTITVMVF